MKGDIRNGYEHRVSVPVKTALRFNQVLSRGLTPSGSLFYCFFAFPLPVFIAEHRQSRGNDRSVNPIHSKERF